MSFLLFFDIICLECLQRFDRKSIRSVKIEWWGVGVVICLERGADCLHVVQLMPLHPETPSSLASFKSWLVLPFFYGLTQVVLEKRPLNRCSSSSSSNLPLILAVKLFRFAVNDNISTMQSRSWGLVLLAMMSVWIYQCHIFRWSSLFPTSEFRSATCASFCLRRRWPTLLACRPRNCWRTRRRRCVLLWVKSDWLIGSWSWGFMSYSTQNRNAKNHVWLSSDFGTWQHGCHPHSGLFVKWTLMLSTVYWQLGLPNLLSASKSTHTLWLVTVSLYPPRPQWIMKWYLTALKNQWLIDWLLAWLVSWLIDRLIACLLLACLCLEQSAGCDLSQPISGCLQTFTENSLVDSVFLLTLFQLLLVCAPLTL